MRSPRLQHLLPAIIVLALFFLLTLIPALPAHSLSLWFTTVLTYKGWCRSDVSLSAQCRAVPRATWGARLATKIVDMVLFKFTTQCYTVAMTILYRSHI